MYFHIENQVDDIFKTFKIDQETLFYDVINRNQIARRLYRYVSKNRVRDMVREFLKNEIGEKDMLAGLMSQAILLKKFR